MKDRDKNRDPERAKKRATADARCALRKLGLLDELAELQAKGRSGADCTTYVLKLGKALDLGT